MNRVCMPVQESIPVCAGTGLIALDVVLNGNADAKPRLWTGGSCGNVLTILAYLGWTALPVARLGNDVAAKRILEDLKQFGVKLDFIEQDEHIKTPIIIERIRKGVDGTPTHRFFFVCPNCGTWLPRYRPILLSSVRRAATRFPEINCFYFDRVAPGTLELAANARAAGALVIFEPPSIKDEEIFKEAVQISHILKYAQDHMGHCNDHLLDNGPILIIETMGSSGVRYRFQNQGKASLSWKILPPFQVSNIRDAAGSGDWCTAGIIYTLGNYGSRGLEKASEKQIIEALEIGQAMAALNCSFEGARGGMYSLKKAEFNRSIDLILSTRIASESSTENIPDEVSDLFRCLCPGCRGGIRDDMKELA